MDLEILSKVQKMVEELKDDTESLGKLREIITTKVPQILVNYREKQSERAARSMDKKRD